MKKAESDPLPILTSTTRVYISNVSEDVWEFISQMSGSGVRQQEIDENAFLSDRDLLALAGEDNVIVILPHTINRDFLEYYLHLFGNKNLKVLVPQKHTGQICLDILNDPLILNEIKKAAANTKRLELTSYSSSHQFFSLVKFLVKAGLPVHTPESPEEADLWTVNFYGSKGGFRQLAQQSVINEPDLKMSPGMVSSGIYDTAKIAAKMYLKKGGVVLKTNKGHSGAGMYILRAGDLATNYTECEQQILALLKKDAYWDKFPIVVEELMNINASLGGGNPNVEFKILKSGKVEFLYYCGMRVTNDGVFKGVEINKDVLSDKVVAQMMDTGFYVGEMYASQGYRGYYDVDFVATKNNGLYLTESNVRRTGGTHVYHAAVSLLGKDFMYETFTLSNNLWTLPTQIKLSFTQLLSHLEPILFNKKTKEGVVLAAANLLQSNQIAYIVFGETKKRALELEGQMEEIIRSI